MALPRPAACLASFFLFACAFSLFGPNHGLWAQEKPAASQPESPDGLEKNWKVRVLVNGKPLYFEEICFMGLSPQFIQGLIRLSPAEQTEKKKEFLTKERERIIDQELMYQAAIHRLENGNSKMLVKINKFAHDEFEKQLSRVRDSYTNSKDVPNIVQMREFAKLLERKVVREFIATEYAKSRCMPRNSGIWGPTATEIKDYYDEHRDEFQQPYDDILDSLIRELVRKVIFDRECQRVIRELRSRAKIEIVEDAK